MIALISLSAIAVVEATPAVATPRAAAAAKCAPPRGPGDNLIHSANVRTRHVGCAAARKVMLRCDRFSYGHSGHCRAVGRRWYCTSRSLGPLESNEKCTASGRRSISWVWLD